MKISINRNQVLIAIGLLSTEGPDIAAVAAWLPTLGIPHLTGLIHLLGTVSLMLGGLALAWPRIRGLLAAGGLATPPGAQAPWDPKLNPTVVPVPPVSLVPPATPPAPRGPISPSNLGVLVFLVSALLSTAAMAQTAPLDCGPLGVAVNSLNICIVPSTAGGQVFNLKTGSVTNIALLVGIAAIHQDNLSLGAGLYCGADLALSTPNGFMCAGLVSIKNYGAFGSGFSSYHDSLAKQQIFQGLVMYAGTLHFGGTPSTLAARRDEKAAAELDYYVRGLKDGTALKSVGK